MIYQFKPMSKSFWKYKPENSSKELGFEDFMTLARGNYNYAVSLRNRVEWQHPETLVQDDLAEGEVILINEQFIITDGNTDLIEKLKNI
jgi:hypothetical protein